MQRKWQPSLNKYRSQKIEKLDIVEERDFRREELPEKYIIKMLYRWNDEKFEKGVILKLKTLDFILFSYFFVVFNFLYLNLVKKQ